MAFRKKTPGWLGLCCAVTVGFQCLATGVEVPDNWRDPFWPVGYTPKVEEPEKEIGEQVVEVKDKPADPAPKPVEDPKPKVNWGKAQRHLRVSGFFEANGKKMCLINGRRYAEGDTVTYDLEGYRYSWKVTGVDRDPAKRKFDELSVAKIVRAKD